MILEKAIQAAHAAICEQSLDDCLDPDWRGKCVKAVEAAAPSIQAVTLESTADAIEDDPYDDLDPFYAGWLRDRARKIKEGGMIHKPAETVIRDSSGRVLDQWVESDDDDPCCDECLAWATGADVDEQTRQHALQDAINAAHERQQWAQQDVFLRKRDECPPRMEGDKPHCPDCAGIVGETGIVVW